MAHSVGIDVSKSKLDLALLIDGKIRRTKIVSNDMPGFKQLLAWLESHVPGGLAAAHVAMEATGVYGEAVALFLCDHGVVVSIINPLQIKRYGESKLMRNKTDKADAALIAQFCAAERPQPWQPPSLGVRTLQALVLRLDMLLSMERAELNRFDVAHVAVKPSIQAVLDSLKLAMVEVRKQIKDTIDEDPDLKNRRDLLDSIPGLGDRTIPQLLAFIGRPERFTSSKALTAYAGLSTAIKLSGSSLRKTHGTTPHGNVQLKRCLYFPAMVAGRFNPLVRTFWQRLEAQGKPGKVIVVACMHKLLTIIYGVLKSGKPFDPKHANA